MWEDAEYLEYLERALDWWNMQPPETESLKNLTPVSSKEARVEDTHITGRDTVRCNGFTSELIVDEFDYSIGGISLSLDRSSKYEGLKSSAEQMWSMSVDAKSRTTKFMRGLSQPKYGIGISLRSDLTLARGS